MNGLRRIISAAVRRSAKRRPTGEAQPFFSLESFFQPKELFFVSGI